LEDANCVAGTAYTKDLITAEDYFTENSTITVTQLPDVDAGSETASVEGPISWSYEPDVIPVWNNGAWDVNPTASTKVIKINSSSGATYNAGGDYTTVYVIGTGTQPIGEYGLTAGTLVIESGASINMANVTATTVIGEGTAIYTLGTSGGYVTSAEKPFTDSRWTGTVELKDCYINAIVLQHYGNSGSTVRANNLNGYLKANTEDIAEVKAVEIGTGGFTLNNGLHSQRWVFSAAITGTGDFKIGTSSNASSGKISQFVFIGDMDGFGGNLNFGTLTSAEPEIIIAPDKASIPDKANYDSSATRAKISILSGASATIASGKTWSTSSRGSDYPNWQVDGTLRIKGSIYGGAGGAGSQWCRCQGTGTVIFDGKFPGGSEYGEAWWNGTNWAGTLEITNATTATAIYLQQLGSSQSTVRFSGFTGQMKAGGNSIKAVEIGPAGWTLNGTFAPTIPADLKGPGVLTVSTTGDSAKTITFSGDVSAFAGKVAFSGDENSRVLLGAASTDRTMSKSVIIGEGATCVMGQAWDSVYYDIYVDGQLTVGKRLGTFNAMGIGQSGTLEVVSGGFVWATDGITVDGTMKAPKYDTGTYFGGGTTITVNSTGVFELGANAGDVDVNGVSHAKITGTGTVKFPSTSTGYYTMPSSADKMFATTLSVINDNANALIVTFNNNTSAVTTNRNMHGSGSYRSDWGSGTSRGLLALQDKNTEWSGTFYTAKDHRIKEFIVAGVDGASQKTLKLSGAQVLAGSTPLTVESAGSANLTGTWYGNATVDGEFGGTGTLNGDLTFGTGSTFKAFASDEDGLSVTGTVSYPESGTVTVDVSDLGSPESDVVLISKSGLDDNKFTLKSGSPAGYTLAVEDDALKLKTPAPVTITVPVIANTTVTVTVGDDEQVGVDGDGVKTYSIPYGSAVVVTYTAVSGYKISGIDTYNIASATTDETITVDEDLSSDLIVATFNGTSYTTLQAAVNAWAAADMMVAFVNPVRLSCDVPDGLTIPAHNSGNSAVELQLNGDNHTLTGSVTISANATLKPSNITLSGDLTVNGTLDVTTTLSVGGDVTFGDGSCIIVTTLSDSVAKVTATGDLTVAGDLLVYLNSNSLEAGTYLLATGASVDAEDAVATVQLNGTEDPAWTFSTTETSLVLKAVAAEVEGVKYETFADAVDAADGEETITLLANASYTLSVGETLIVDAGSFTMTVTAPAGYAVSQSGSGVVTYTTQKYVARLQNPQDGTSTYQPAVDYTSLAAAVAAVTERSAGYYGGGDAIVTLLDNVALDATVTVGKKMILNLNGKTLTASGTAAINNGTRLAVQGSGSIAVTSGNSVVLTATSATLTVSGGATLSPEPTVSDTVNYRAKKTTDAGTATYTVVDKYGTIFLVY
jgi:hypothetical protein